MSLFRRYRWFLVCIPLLLVLPAGAQDHAGQAFDPSATQAYWTASRFAAAKPLDATLGEAPSPDGPAERSSSGSFLWPSSEPTSPRLQELGTRLFQPQNPSPHANDASVSARDAGTAKAHFSSSRLLPLEADRFFPYATVGKLFFRVPGSGPAVCSGAVIARRLVLTAGHCVHSGTASPGFYRDFVFVPAFRDGAAPFGSWPATYVLVTGTWATGGGGFPNPSDFAILELDDVFSGGQLHRIGDVVGWLGILTNALRQNHVHILGYPLNLDGGNKMHQVTGAIKKFTPAVNSSTVGSDMRQGSSGGPWIQNFGVPANGQQVAGGNRRLNLIVGVTSFVPVATGPKTAGSSMPDVRLVELFTATCAHTPGNC